MFMQKIRAIFEWFAQKRAAKDREVLNYQWTTCRSNKADDQQQPQPAAHTDKKVQATNRSTPQKSVAPDDFTATVSSDTSRIEPQVEIDVDALFDETKPQTKPKVTRNKSPKSASGAVKKEATETAKAKTTKTPKKVSVSKTVETSEESVPAVKKTTTAVKPRVRKTQAKSGETQKPATDLTGAEKPVQTPKKTRQTAAKDPVAKKPAAKTTVAKRAAKVKVDAQAEPADYREIVRVNTLKKLQELLKETYPQVVDFKRKFDMSAFLRETPEAVELLKGKLGQAV